MKLSIDQLFASAGLPRHGTHQGPGCPADEAFADYLGAQLPAAEREALELHALACGDCHDLLCMVVDVMAGQPQLAAAHAAAPVSARTHQASPVRIVARLAQRGIELLNHAELTFRSLVDPPMPALGLVRGATEAPATSERLAVRGPGAGLDELELEVQPNGTARLVVRCDQMPALQPGEVASILLDVDGFAREKRPFGGEPVTFAPISRGSYRVRLVARAPGGPARPLAEARLELTA